MGQSVAEANSVIICVMYVNEPTEAAALLSHGHISACDAYRTLTILHKKLHHVQESSIN